MKALIICLLFATQSWAVPVLNRNMAADGTLVTIWPDHKDPDHFYFAPNFMKIASDSRQEAKFHITQYHTGSCGRIGGSLGRCKTKALMSTLLVAGFEEQQLIAAQAGIRRLRPSARFSAIPFLGSQVQFGESLDTFIEGHDCNPKAGQAADEVPCTMTFNYRGITKILPSLDKGLIIPFKFIYRISGLIDDGSGQFRETTLEYGLTVKLGGEVIAGHPDFNELI